MVVARHLKPKFLVISTRIMVAEISQQGSLFAIINIYAPQADDPEVTGFFSQLEATIAEIRQEAHLILMGDMNARYTFWQTARKRSGYTNDEFFAGELFAGVPSFTAAVDVAGMVGQGESHAGLCRYGCDDMAQVPQRLGASTLSVSIRTAANGS